MAGKKFTKKELVKRMRANHRRFALKVNPQFNGRKPTLAEQNKEVIDRLEAALK